jgi:tRNA/tmRNA/rRNA uracil-C5-methylase (TrmA/RlmC/RlmD family)
MKKITKDNYIKNFFELRYRDIVLKPALKIINKHQKKAEITFWTMPFDSICREIILNKLYESSLLNAMCSIVKDKNTVALDVGANIGNHSLYFAKYFKKVISFEPAPNNCWIFKANIFLNRVKNVILIEKAYQIKT